MIDTGIILEDKRGKKRINPKAKIPNGHILESMMDGSYAYWIKLPQDLAWTFFEDGGHPNSFPSMTSMFPDLESIADYA